MLNTYYVHVKCWNTRVNKTDMVPTLQGIVLEMGTGK